MYLFPLLAEKINEKLKKNHNNTTTQKVQSD
jgi:hypothetical protein